MAVTSNLGIPLIAGSDKFGKESVNNALREIDKNALPVGHASSVSHWPMWQASTAFAKGDIVKMEGLPSWGYLECTIAGITGANKPTGLYGEGDTKPDGTATWTLRRLAAGSLRNHKDLDGRALPDQHGIGAITGLQTALDEKAKADTVYTKEESDAKDKVLQDAIDAANVEIGKKADKTQLHSHANKATLDKLGEADGELTFDGKALGSCRPWVTGTAYKAGNVVTRANQIYICLLDHTAGTWAADAAKWQSVGVGNIPEWTAGVTFKKWDVVTRGTNVIRCLTPHVSADYAAERNNWEIITGKGATLAEWKPRTPYEEGEAVVIADTIYRCIVAHTSSDTLAADMLPGSEKWKPINSNGGMGAMKQVTRLGVTTTTIIDVPINYSGTFMLPPVEVLKFVPGLQNQVLTECEFNAADAAGFTVDGVAGELAPNMIFDGVMKPRTSYPLAFDDGAALEDGKVYESGWVDTTAYKKIDAVSVV